MSEHAHGRGSVLTRKALNIGVEVYLARVFPALTFADEKRVKARSHFKDFCPLCCPLLQSLKSDVHRIVPVPPVNFPEFAIWDARAPAVTIRTNTNEKGRPR